MTLRYRAMVSRTERVSSTENVFLMLWAALSALGSKSKRGVGKQPVLWYTNAISVKGMACGTGAKLNPVPLTRMCRAKRGTHKQ